MKVQVTRSEDEVREVQAPIPLDIVTECDQREFAPSAAPDYNGVRREVSQES